MAENSIMGMGFLKTIIGGGTFLLIQALELQRRLIQASTNNLKCYLNA